MTEEEERFAGELKRMLTDAKLAEDYRKKAVKRAEEFSLESYKRNLEELIRKDT